MTKKTKKTVLKIQVPSSALIATKEALSNQTYTCESQRIITTFRIELAENLTEDAYKKQVLTLWKQLQEKKIPLYFMQSFGSTPLKGKGFDTPFSFEKLERTHSLNNLTITLDNLREEGILFPTRKAIAAVHLGLFNNVPERKPVMRKSTDQLIVDFSKNIEKLIVVDAANQNHAFLLWYETIKAVNSDKKNHASYRMLMKDFDDYFNNKYSASVLAYYGLNKDDKQSIHSFLSQQIAIWNKLYNDSLEEDKEPVYEVFITLMISTLPLMLCAILYVLIFLTLPLIASPAATPILLAVFAVLAVATGIILGLNAGAASFLSMRHNSQENINFCNNMISTVSEVQKAIIDINASSQNDDNIDDENEELNHYQF